MPRYDTDDGRDGSTENTNCCIKLHIIYGKNSTIE